MIKKIFEYINEYGKLESLSLMNVNFELVNIINLKNLSFLHLHNVDSINQDSL